MAPFVANHLDVYNSQPGVALMQMPFDKCKILKFSAPFEPNKRPSLFRDGTFCMSPLRIRITISSHSWTHPDCHCAVYIVYHLLEASRVHAQLRKN